jgi:uncharacterized membrane protein SpoIIM required for sporulation
MYKNFRRDFMRGLRNLERTANFKNTMIEYMKNNSKEYILVILIFIIGLFIGVIFINNCSNENENTITNYISNFIEKFDNIEDVDELSLLANSVKSNILLAIIIWLAGTTIIGMPIVIRNNII